MAARAIHYCLVCRNRVRACELLRNAGVESVLQLLWSNVISTHIYPVLRIVSAKILDVWYTDISHYIDTIPKLATNLEIEPESKTVNIDDYDDEERELVDGREKLEMVLGKYVFNLFETQMNALSSFSKGSLIKQGLCCSCEDLQVEINNSRHHFKMLHQDCGSDHVFPNQSLKLFQLRFQNDTDDELTGTDSLNQPSDSTHIDLHGVILLWLIVLQKIDSISYYSTSDDNIPIRAICGTYIAKTNIVNSLLHTLIDDQQSTSRKTDALDLSGLFQKMNPMISFYGLDSEGLSYLVSYALHRSICCAPAMMRLFWNDYCSRLQKSVIETFVQERVSGSLIKREIAIVVSGQRSGRWKSDELDIKCSAVSREITAVYTADEIEIELTICVSPLYPLCNVEIICHKKMGISVSRWRRWTLQIIQLLSQQDGSVLDAILLWKKNVDKEFAGVEPCPICYSILHPKSHQMPGLACPTCKNKFHSSCLYKWFHSSGKSKCVLCQQPFF
jgi:hypothetical protein